MALPTTITLDLPSGPFLSSAGNVYVFGQDQTDESLMRAFKATDPTSSFSNIGTDFDVDSTVGFAIASQALVQIGDVIHIVTKTASTGSSTSDIKYHTFNMATDAWVITNETVTNCVAVSSNTVSTIGISARSDGDIIVIYNGDSVANMGSDRDRVYYARREGGVWTVDVVVDNGGATSWYAAGIVLGSSDRMHLFFFDGGAADGYQRCLRSANTLETFPASFDATVSTVVVRHKNLGDSYVSGANTKVRYPIPDATASTINSVKLDSADTPTVSQDADITGTTSWSDAEYGSSFVSDGTTLWHIFVESASDDIYTQSNADDAGWSAPESFHAGTGVIVQPKSNIYTRGGSLVIGIVFGDGSDIKYHEKVLSTAGSAVSATTTASVTWTGNSTASTSLSASALASVTWTGNGLYPAAFTHTAVASATFNGAEIQAASAADWSSAAVASVTWNGTGLYPAAFDSDATASVTWNGASTASVDLDSDAAASLTWNGASTASSVLDADAAASLTWAGTMVVNAAWSSTAAASVTWNGVEVTVASAAFDMDAAASLTWNGASLAYSAWSSQAAATLQATGASTAASAAAETAVALLTWNGASSATSAWSANATALVTWAGTMVVNAAWSSTAAASLTWNGASVATVNAAFDSAAAVSLTWNGAAVASTAWSSAAAAVQSWNGAASASSSLSAASLANLTWNGSATTAASLSAAATASLTWNGSVVAASAWAAASLASLVWEGAAVSGAFSEGAVSITAAASVTFTSTTVAAAAFTATAVADAVFKGADASVAAVVRNIDGWRVKHLQRQAFEEAEEEDIIVMSTALYNFVGLGQ